MTAAKEVGTEYLGERGVIELPVENGLHLRVAPGNGIADNNESIFAGKIFWTIAGANFDTSRDEEVAHRRIGLIVRAGDDPALLLHRHGHSSHGRSADAQEVHATRGVIHRDEGDKWDISKKPEEAGLPSAGP
jgi:hypothetical protein